MAPSRRSGRFLHHGFPCDVERDICPGWLVSLPMVIEATRAFGWAKIGLLKEFYEGQTLPKVLFDAIDVFSFEVETVKAAIMKDASDG